jgi:hypothetical protein
MILLAVLVVRPIRQSAIASLPQYLSSFGLELCTTFREICHPSLAEAWDLWRKLRSTNKNSLQSGSDEVYPSIARPASCGLKKSAIDCIGFVGDVCVLCG